MLARMWIPVIALALLTAACGKGLSNAETTALTFTLVWEQPQALTARTAGGSPNAAAASTGTCADYGITTINTRLFTADHSLATQASWTCSNQAGYSLHVPAGTDYSLIVKAQDAAGAVLWQGQQTGINVDAGQTVSLGAVPMTYLVNDTVLPRIISTKPGDNATGVPVTASISVTFSKAVDLTTVNEATFIVKAGSAMVAGKASYDAATGTARFLPTSPLSSNTFYTATVTDNVKDMAGNAMSAGYTWNFTTEPSSGSPPGAPFVKAALEVSKVTVTWDPVPGATSYNLYWSTTPGVPITFGTRIRNAVSPYVQSGLAPNTTYSYVVTAQNGAGESAESNLVSVSIPPMAPTDVIAASGNNQTTTTVTWSPVDGAQSYNIYWSTSPLVTKATWAKVENVASPYTQTRLADGKTYYYFVTAASSFGESEESQEVSSADISIANWLNGKEAALSFTFDDGCISQITTIAPLLENYGFRGTFFVIAGFLKPDIVAGFQQLSLRGHEIGNHSWHHYDLTFLGTDSLAQEITVPISMLEQDFGKRPVSFCQPGNLTNPTVDEEVLKTHLFARISSEYDLSNRVYIHPNSTYTNLDKMKIQVETALNNKQWLIVAGHGVDGDGFSPISSALLDSFIAYVFSQNNSFWVDTLGHVGQYDYLRREINLIAEKQGDILTISFNGYNSIKYQDMDTSPISIVIPQQNVKVLNNDNVIVNTVGDNTIITVDLKYTSQMQLSLVP